MMMNILERDINFEPTDYYMKPLEMAFLERDDEDYFNVLRREHFIQSFQSLSFARNLPDITAQQLNEKSILLKKAPEHESKPLLL